MTTTHEIVKVEKCVLVIEKKPTWIIPTAYFSILFDTEPSRVLKYGPNGLHFTEHILWCSINEHYKFQHTNAVTFSSGEMGVFGIAPSDDLDKAINGFFDGIADVMSKKKTQAFKRIYKTEQRRVSAETFRSRERSLTAKEGAEARMFTYNMDLLRADYPTAYLQHILLEECELQKVVVMAHCAVSEDSRALFRSHAEKFIASWKDRKKGLLPVSLPLFYAPPMSSLQAHGSSRETMSISLKPVANPIERMIISLHMTPNFPPQYYLKMEVPHWRLSNPTNAMGKNTLSCLSAILNEQYFAVDIIASSGEELEVEWIDDLHNLSPTELLKKYKKKAIDSMKTLLDID